ncbi:cubilin-like [Babylonia areolata]|uniref:cubilin-like n=1 Tax=Babylonia areolata TaxID=304850 RepID=UPI003FD1C41A
MRASCLVTGLGLLLLVTHMLGSVMSHSTVRCDGKERSLHVPPGTTGILYSPNYPRRYHNSDECTWVLRTGEAGKVMEVEVVEMDLEKDKTDTCVDFLTAFDGDSSDRPLLKKWCGQDKTIVRSSGQAITLYFSSNEFVRYPGFVVKYRATVPYSSDCVEGGERSVAVGTTPVLVQLSHLNTTRTCRWRVEGRGDVRLVMEVVHFSGSLNCRDGNLTFADGGDDSAVEVDSWCGSSSPPFSTFYTSGREALMTTTTLPPERRTSSFVSLELWVRVHAVPIEEECSMNTPTVLEFEQAPLYFPVPFSSWTSGEECTIRVNTLTPNDGGFRVDVLTSGGRQASCEEDLEDLGLWISDGKRVDAECWRGEHPVHWTHTQSISVLPRQNTTAFLRVQPTAFPCTGYVIDRLYDGSHSVTNTIRDIGYPRNAQCQILIESSEDDHPVVQLTANMLGEEGCGDQVTVYNGSSTEGEVLLTYCAGSEVELRKRQVVSPGNALLLVLSTDNDDTHGEGLDVQYFSVPETDLCVGKQKQLYATSQTKTLQSPNFPKYYHLNYDCFYNIKTNISGEVIHVKLVSAEFDSMDYLQFYDHGTVKMGRVSGNDQQREFTSSRQSLTVRFHSDENLSDGGWRLEYRSVSPTDLGGGDDMAFNTMTLIVAASLGVVIVILIVVVIVLSCKSRSSPPPPVHL